MIIQATLEFQVPDTCNAAKELQAVWDLMLGINQLFQERNSFEQYQYRKLAQESGLQDFDTQEQLGKTRNVQMQAERYAHALRTLKVGFRQSTPRSTPEFGMCNLSGGDEGI